MASSRMHVSVESKETPLNFAGAQNAFTGPLQTKSTSPRPATKTGSVPRDECFDAYNAPKPDGPVVQKDQLNLFGGAANDENVPPTSRVGGCRDHNAESTAQQATHSKCTGVKRVDAPAIPVEGPTSIKIVEGAPNRERTCTVVGAGAVAPTSPVPNRSVSPRPNSASTPMGTVLTMDKQLLSHTAPTDVVGTARPRSVSMPLGAKRSRELTLAEKIVEVITTNIAARHGSVANFFFHLARGTVGHIGALEQAQGSKIPVETLREQLCAVVTTTIDVETFNTIFFGEGADPATVPKFVSFADFTEAFPDTR